ncbi:MAG: hypothetical protein K6F32_06135 [Bacilli bacterium]|nr:hypothetical protein [Bacilli bacterium]
MEHHASSRIKWKHRTPENDIAYGGFLSYRAVRIIAWVCMVLAQIAVIMNFNVKVNPGSEEALATPISIFDFFSTLPIPLFMLANFTQIMQGRDELKRGMIRYGAMAVGMYIVANLVVLHYGFRLSNAFTGKIGFYNSSMLFGVFLAAVGRVGYSMNVFIDLFLCFLLFFFMNYNPKKIFTGKKVIFFRVLVLLPIAYEIAAIFVKYNISLGSLYGGFDIPSFVFFLLPGKPPFIFLAFVAIVFLMKISERRYLKEPGHTHATYAEYITTNAHSLRVSIMISIVFAACAVVDIIVTFSSMIGVTASIAINSPQITDEVALEIAVDGLSNTGLLGSITLLFIIPIVLLFSYKKVHKNPKVDMFIPIAGIALMLFVYVEGIFQVVTLNLAQFVAKVKEVIDSLSTEDTATDGSEELLASIANTAKGIWLSLPYLF